MKKIFTLSFLLLLLATLFMGNALAQSGNTWLQKANVGGGGRWVGVGFSIGTKGYIGTGLNAADVPIADFWEYDPAGNTWSQKANFGGGVRFGAIGFGIGAKGYVGTGSTNSGGFRDFWEYDPSANTWTRKADFGGTERYLAVGFAIGAKGYVGTGVSLGSNPDTNDFWEYNPATNTWTRKADFAGITRFAATGFGIGTKGYIGIGSNENSYERSDFWEYDPTANAWTAKAAFGGGAQTYATGFSIGSKGYIGTGEVGGAGFWEYNPATNTWTRKANYGGTNNSLWYTSGFSIGAKGYIGTGYDPNGPLRNDFWEYTPSGTAASAINFDGVNDYVAVSNPYKTFNKEITVEFWMNAASASMPFGSIMGQGVEGKDDMANNVWLMHPNNDGTMSFYVNDAGTWRFTTFSITGIVGTWHHIAGVTGPFGTKVYIDGVLVASGAGVTGTILNNASSVLHLGKDVRYASSRFANISLDEVRIWSRALCQAEIINNKNCEPNASAQTGLQEYYRFNQGLQNTDNTGVTTLSDASGNGRNGVLNNFGLTGLTSNWIASGSTNTGTCGAYAASTAPITGSLSICTGAGTTLSNANAGGIWTSSNTAVATIDAATGAVNSLSAGTSTITYKTECGGVSTATLTVNAYPVAAITGPNTVCANQPATLTASGGGTYLWSTGATTSAITIAPSSTNTYAVTVTGAGGCASSANITVNVNALPVLTVGSNSPVQTGASLNLTASGAASYSWTGPNSFTSTDQNPSVPAVTSAASGIYTVTGTSAQNCSASAALSVIVSTPAGALKFDPSLAIGDNSRLNYVGIDNPFRAYQKEITVEFWMYVPNANLPFGSVMGQSNNNDDQTLVWLMHPNSNGTMTFFVNDGGTLRGVTGNIIAGSWHHYAGVANATSTKYYIDGVLMNTGPGVSNAILSNPTSVIHIGKDVRYATRYAPNNDLTNRYATMIMDEVRVWSRALCAQEINNNKNCELFNPTGQNKLESYYNFNQGIAGGNNTAVTTLNDLSGNNRNGTLYNFTLNGANSNWVASGSTNTGTCASYVAPAAPITGSTSICMGTGTTLSNANSGGVWSSSNTNVATINASSGLVNSVGAGNTVITYKTDCGGVSTLTVTVGDNIPPVIACPSNKTLASCDAVIPNYTTSATVSDNCTAVAGIIVTQSPAAGTAIAPGANVTVTLTASDASNNTSTCSFTVTRPNLTPTANADAATVCAGSSVSVNVLANDSHPQGAALTVSDNTVPSVGTLVKNANNTFTYTAPAGYSGPVTFTYTTKANDGKIPFSGNNHYYEFVSAPGVTWTDAKGRAAAASYNGLQGYLVTVTSAAEQAFVNTKLNGAGWMGASDAAAEGIWRWVTGPEGLENGGQGRIFSNQSILGFCSANTGQGVSGNYVNWAPGEPNNCGGEHYGHFYAGTGLWNDWPDNVSASQLLGYMVEYGGLESCTPVLTATATVTITVNKAPSFTTCPSPITVNAGANCSADVSYNAVVTGTPTPTVTYIFSGATTGNGIGTGSGSTFNRGVTNITITAINSCGSTTCSFTVTVLDVTAPTISCPSNQILNLDASCNATLPDYRSLVTGVDNCTASNALVITQSPAAGTVVNSKGALIVTFTVTDASNNSSTCNISVDKQDVTAPLITCPAPIAVNNSANTCGAVVNFINPTATDNCSGAAFNFWNSGEPNDANVAHEDYLQLYNSATWNDLPNSVLNKSIVEFNSIISTTFANYSLIGTFGGHTYYISTGTATWTSSRTAAQAIGGDLASINTLAESQYLAPYGGSTWVGGYQDHSDPAYTEPGNASQNYGGWKWVDGTKLGAGQITITQIAGLPSGSTFPVGVTTNTFRATDESGNFSTCSFTVTVTDNQAPTFSSCPSNISTNATSAGGAVVTYTAPVGTDNCPGSTTTRIAGLASGSTFPIGTTTVTHRVTDASGNTANCSFTVTVVAVAPVIHCPANMTVNNAAGQCGANVNFAATETTGIPASTITYSHASGSFFPVGTTTVTATATNSVGSSNCSFNVTVVDATAPTISCPSNQTLNLDASCNATLPDYRTLLTVSDNCTAAGSLVIIQSPAAGTVVNTKGALIVTFTVKDASNNSSTCTITVDKLDVTAPVINCVAPIAVNNNTNICGAAVTYAIPTATDNCSGSAFNFFNGGEPNDANAAHEDYLQLFNSGTWNDLPNANLNRSIVEFNSVISTVFANYTLIGSFGGHTYYISTGTASWTSSRTAAQAIGGDLASINTLGESQFLAPNGGNTWVGGYHDHSDPLYVEPGNAAQNFGGWKWVDGTKLGAGQITITQIAGLPSGSTFPIGVTTNTFRATDESGNSSTCSFTVTVTDNQAPTISGCPSNISATATSAGGTVVTYTAPVGTDNCPGSTTTRIAGLASGSTFPIGTTVVTHRVTDAAGLTAQCSFTVTVAGLAPVISCPANITVDAVAGQCGATVTFAATETAAIPASTISYTENGNPVTSGSFFAVGTHTIFAAAVNAVGTSTCNFTITVVDNQFPVLTGVPSDITVECNAVPSAATITATDNCSTSVPAFTETRTEGDCPDRYTLTRTWSTTDASGNNTTATQVITVQDTQSPVLSDAPTDATVECNAVPIAAILTATDNCSTPVVTYSEVRTDGDCPNRYTLTRTWTATDACGNTSSKTQVITVQDTQAPVLSDAPTNATVECNAVPTAAILTATDNCSTPVVTYSEVRTDGDCPNRYTLTRTWIATDACGNTSSKTQVITVQDTQAPVLSDAPTNATVECNAVPAAAILTATDNCSTPVVTYSEVRTDGDCPNRYTLTRTWTATDACGNTSSKTQVITVQDTQVPLLSDAPADATVECNAVPAAAILTATDNCSTPVVTYSEVRTDGDCPNRYTLTRTWTVTDACGNTSSKTQVITVQDTQAPVLSDAPTNATVECNAVPAAAILTATDNCSTPVVTYSEVRTDGDCPNRYTLTRTWTATDACGNTSSKTQVITVQDTQVPVISDAPLDATVECNAVPVAATLTATDNCSTPVVTYSEVRTDGDCPNRYTLTRTWIATDACGNTSSKTQVITVQDTQVPVLSDAPADVTVECNAVPAAAILTATDNCSTPIVTYSEVRTDGDCPNRYTLTRTWIATDACGNTSSKTQVITVQDTQAPVLSDAPADATVECNAVPAAAILTATDNCSTPVVIYNEVRTDGDCPNRYTLTRTWTATDACGNTSSKTQVITVQDTQAPVLSDAPADATVECNAVPAAAILTATDNCSTPVVTYSEVRTDGDCPNRYTLTRTWTATDACGNTSSKTQKITVQDTQAPVLSDAPADATVECSAVPAAAILTATDNCSTPTVVYTELRTDGSNPNNYTLTRTWTATDACGNYSSKTQVITVHDVTSPVISCPASITLNCQDNNSSAYTGIATATDNCTPSANITITQTDVSTYSANPSSVLHYNYVISRTWRATDVTGNYSECVQTITVRDITAPVITCPASITLNCQDNTTSATTGVATATDNCTPSASITITQTDVSTYSSNPSNVLHYNYVISRTWRATDVTGNYSECVQTITVRDITAPVITCPASIILNCQDNTTSATTGVATATDICTGSTNISITQNDVSTYSSNPSDVLHYNYVISRTWRATDVAGNYSQCVQTITVHDVTKPVLTYVPANVSLLCSAPITPSATGMATGTDNCAAPAISYTDVVSADGLQVTRTWKAMDVGGNFVTGVQVITFIPLSVSIVSVPTSNVFTGGSSTNLYIGYGAQSTVLQVNASSQPAAGAPYTYSWSGSNLSQLSSVSSSAPVFTVGNTSGYYTYTVTVTNRYGCSKTATISLCVTDVRIAGSNGNGKVYVCHLPPGNPGNRQTLSISVNAVSAHLGNHTGDRLGSCDVAPCAAPVVSSTTPVITRATKEATTEVATTEEELKVTVMPNPSTTYFTLKLESKYETPVNMRVMDGRGRVVDARSKIGANSTIQIGHNYSSGVYYAELIQGSKRKVVQLIKGKG